MTSPPPGPAALRRVRPQGVRVGVRGTRGVQKRLEKRQQADVRRAHRRRQEVPHPRKDAGEEYQRGETRGGVGEPRRAAQQLPLGRTEGVLTPRRGSIESIKVSRGRRGRTSAFDAERPSRVSRLRYTTRPSERIDSREYSHEPPRFESASLRFLAPASPPSLSFLLHPPSAAPGAGFSFRVEPSSTFFRFFLALSGFGPFAFGFAYRTFVRTRASRPARIPPARASRARRPSAPRRSPFGSPRPSRRRRSGAPSAAPTCAQTPRARRGGRSRARA